MLFSGRFDDRHAFPQLSDVTDLSAFRHMFPDADKKPQEAKRKASAEYLLNGNLRHKRYVEHVGGETGATKQSLQKDYKNTLGPSLL